MTYNMCAVVSVSGEVLPSISQHQPFGLRVWSTHPATTRRVWGRDSLKQSIDKALLLSPFYTLSLLWLYNELQVCVSVWLRAGLRYTHTHKHRAERQMKVQNPHSLLCSNQCCSLSNWSLMPSLSLQAHWAREDGGILNDFIFYKHQTTKPAQYAWNKTQSTHD